MSVEKNARKLMGPRFMLQVANFDAFLFAFTEQLRVVLLNINLSMRPKELQYNLYFNT